MRTTRKRLLSIFLVVMMMFSLVPTMAWAAEEYQLYSISHELTEFGFDYETYPGYVIQPNETLMLKVKDSAGNDMNLTGKTTSYLLGYYEEPAGQLINEGAMKFSSSEEGAYGIDVYYINNNSEEQFISTFVKVTTDYTTAYTKDETRYIIHFDTNELEGMNVTAGRSVADKSVTTPYYLFMGTEFMRDRYHLNYALSSDEYDWLGWYDNAELTGDPVYRMAIAGNTILYAKWKGIPAEFADTPEGMTFQLSRDYVYVLENGMPYLPDTILRATITLPNGFADTWVSQKANDKTMTQAVLDVRDNTNAEEYVFNLKGSELLKLHEAKLDLVVQTNYGIMTIPWEDLDVLGQQATKGDAANAGEGNKSGYDPDIRITINEDGAAAKKRTKATGTFVAVHPNAVKVDYNQEIPLEIDTDAGETYKPDVTVIENDQMKKPEKPYTAMIQMALQ